MTKMKFQCLKCQYTMTQTSPLVPVQFSFYNFVKKYKLPQKARDDLLKLVKQHCPEEAKQRFPKTYSKMLKLLIRYLKKLKSKLFVQLATKLFPRVPHFVKMGMLIDKTTHFFTSLHWNHN